MGDSVDIKPADCGGAVMKYLSSSGWVSGEVEFVSRIFAVLEASSVIFVVVVVSVSPGCSLSVEVVAIFVANVEVTLLGCLLLNPSCSYMAEVITAESSSMDGSRLCVLSVVVFWVVGGS